MKFSKRILLAVLLAFGAIWLGAETSSNGIWNYRLDEKGNVIITGITNEDTERLVIPSTVDGKTVTGIADHAFFRYNAATELVIPNTVTSLGVSAFESCENLEKITLSNKLTLIPDRCFSACESLEEIVIPESVRIIGYMGFAECESLKKAVIPSSLRLIFDYAFAGCPDLDIHIPRPVEVAEDVFYSHDLEKKPLLHVFKGSMAEIIAKEYNYDFEYEPEGAEGDVSEWSDYEDYLGVIESYSHMVGDPLTPEQYQDILNRIEKNLATLDLSQTDKVERTSDGLIAWYADGDFTQIADISGETPYLLSIIEADDDENDLLITVAGQNEYSADYIMLYMYPDLYESYEDYYYEYSYGLYDTLSYWYSGPKPGYDNVEISGEEYLVGILDLLNPDFEIVSPSKLDDEEDDDDVMELSFEKSDAKTTGTQPSAAKNENGKVVVELNLSDSGNTSASKSETAKTGPAKTEIAKLTELDEDIEEYTSAQFIQLVHDLTKMENTAALVPDSVEGMKVDESYYISDGENSIYFAPFSSLPFVYIRIGQDDYNYGIVLAGPNDNVYRTVLLSAGQSSEGRSADNLFDNASIKELYDFIRSEFPVTCIVKTTIRGKEYNVYCGMDEYDSSLDFSFEGN